MVHDPFLSPKKRYNRQQSRLYQQLVAVRALKLQMSFFAFPLVCCVLLFAGSRTLDPVNPEPCFPDTPLAHRIDVGNGPVKLVFLSNMQAREIAHDTNLLKKLLDALEARFRVFTGGCCFSPRAGEKGRSRC